MGPEVRKTSTNVGNLKCRKSCTVHHLGPKILDVVWDFECRCKPFLDDIQGSRTYFHKIVCEASALKPDYQRGRNGNLYVSIHPVSS